MEQFKSALRSLTCEVCRQLDALAIPKRPIWIVVKTPGTAPYSVPYHRQ